MSNADHSPRVDVFEFARTHGVIEGELDLQAAPRLRASLAAGAGRVSYRFAGRIDSHGRPAAQLFVRGEVPLPCDRCGSVVREHIEHRADFYFVREAAELAGLPVLVDEPEPLPGGHAFDLVALVEDEAILSLPLSPRHESCAPRQTPDTAADEDAAETNPFAGLSQLLRKG